MADQGNPANFHNHISAMPLKEAGGALSGYDNVAAILGQKDAAMEKGTYPGIPTKMPLKSVGLVTEPTLPSKSLSGTKMTTNPLMDMIYDQQWQDQEEIERQKRRLAMRSTMNGLGTIVKTLANAYGASKGAMVNPVQDNVSGQISQELAHLKNTEEAQKARFNSIRLQQMMNEMTRSQDWNEFLKKSAVQNQMESYRDNRDFAQQNMILDRNQQFQRDQYGRELADKKVQSQESLAKEKELAKYRSNLQHAENQAMYGPDGLRPYLDPETGLPFSKTPKPTAEIKKNNVPIKMDRGDVANMVTWMKSKKYYDPLLDDISKPQVLDALVNEHYDEYMKEQNPGTSAMPKNFLFPWMNSQATPNSPKKTASQADLDQLKKEYEATYLKK